MVSKYKRYDRCPAYQCTDNITHALVYGCINGHIQETYGCLSHIAYYQLCIPKYHCGKCGMQWEDGDSIMEELWTATTY
jgi:hypothetical protein